METITRVKIVTGEGEAIVQFKDSVIELKGKIRLSLKEVTDPRDSINPKTSCECEITVIKEKTLILRNNYKSFLSVVINGKLIQITGNLEVGFITWNQKERFENGNLFYEPIPESESWSLKIPECLEILGAEHI